MSLFFIIGSNSYIFGLFKSMLYGKSMSSMRYWEIRFKEENNLSPIFDSIFIRIFIIHKFYWSKLHKSWRQQQIRFTIISTKLTSNGTVKLWHWKWIKLSIWTAKTPHGIPPPSHGIGIASSVSTACGPTTKGQRQSLWQLQISR